MSVSGARISTARGPWIADERRRQRAVVEDRLEASEPLGERVADDAGALPALATTRKRSSAEAVDDQVVEDPAVRGDDHRVVGAAVGERRRVGHERVGERLARLRALDEQLAHVRQVEQAGPLPDRPVLLEDPAVLDRHQPAGEVDQPRAERAVRVDERRLERTGASAVSVTASAAAERRAVGVRSRRGARARRSRSTTLGRPADERPLGLEGQQRRRLVEGDPAHLVELVVVAGEVAADRLHQEVVDGLVDPGAPLDEPVLDRIERRR